MNNIKAKFKNVYFTVLDVFHKPQFDSLFTITQILLCFEQPQYKQAVNDKIYTYITFLKTF